MLGNLKNRLRRTTGWILVINIFVLYRNGAKIPDKAYLPAYGGFASSVTTLDIEAAAVPGTMIVALLPVLCLPARTMRQVPLRQQISLCDRQRSGQPEHDYTADQCPRDVSSCFRQHDRFNRVFPTRALQCPTEQLERFRHPKDVADLLLEIAVEIAMDRNLRDEIDRRKIKHVEHDAR